MAAERVVVVRPGEGHRVGNVEFLARSSDTSLFNFAIITIQPRRHGPPAHRRASEDDAFYLLEGELVFTADDDEVVADRDVRARAAGCRAHVREPQRRDRAASTSTRPQASTSGSSRLRPSQPQRGTRAATTGSHTRRLVFVAAWHTSRPPATSSVRRI